MYKQIKFLNENFLNKLILYVLAFFTFASIFTVKYNLRVLLISVIFIVYLLLLFNFISSKNKFKLDKADIVILIYILLVLIYFIKQKNLSVGLKGIFSHLRWIIFYYIGKLSYIKLTKNNIKRIINLIIGIGIITAVYGIYQYYFDYYTLGNLIGNAKVLFKNHDATAHRPRQMYSIFLTPLTTAYVLSLSIIASCVSIIYKFKNFAKQKIIFAINLIIIILLLFALIITYNRTSLVSIICTFIILAISFIFHNKNIVKKFIYKNKLKCIIFLISSCFLIIFSFKYTNIKYFLTVFKFNDTWSTSGHYMYLKKGIEFLLKYPLGLGLGVSTKVGDQITALNTWNESNYFFISTEIGILGLVLFLAAIYFIFSITIKFYKISTETYVKSFNMIALATLISFSISCISLPIYVAWVPTNFIFVILGIINTNSKAIKK